MSSAHLGERESRKGFGKDLITLRQRGVEEWDTRHCKKNEFCYWGHPPPLSFLFLNITYRDYETGDVVLAGILP